MNSPADAALHRLRRLGFQREPILDENGRLEVVLFTRDTPDSDWHDVLLVYPDQQARAYRTRPAATTGNTPADPMAFSTADILLPTGDLVTTVHTLLSLPVSAHAAEEA